MGKMVTPPPPSAPTAPRQTYGITLQKASSERGQRIGIYGPGGVGKTSLAALAPGPVAFIDVEKSLGLLGLDVPEVGGIETFADVLAAVNGDGWDSVKTIVMDSMTKLEEMATAHVLATIKHEKGQAVARIEDYGYGKGYQFIYETMLGLFANLERHIYAGRNVILIAHDCISSVPNPAGEDWIRYEPRLQAPNSGKSSVRLRFREWLDNLFFIGYDVATKDKKGFGCGTRTIYPTEQPHCMAKSRTIQYPLEYVQGDAGLWAEVFKSE